MQIRRARPGDLAAVGALTVAAYAPYLLGPDDDYAEHLRNAEARDLEAELWVAVGNDAGHDDAGRDEAGRVLGSVTVCPEGSPWREVASLGEGEFRMLAVDPALQGGGVGEALVRHCLDRSREVGCTALVMSSLDDMAPAHRLYGRLGFERVPERDWMTDSGVGLIVFRAELA